MSINVYKCNECDFKEEYIESFSTSKDLWHPDICPKCNKGSLEKVFDVTGGSFDIIGWCYKNVWGSHAYKKNMSQVDQAAVLNGDKDPY